MDLFPNFIPFSLVIVCLTWLAECGKPVQFKHKVWGTVVPCRWTDAKGMLCPKNGVKVVIFPTAAQSKVMSKNGIPLPKGFERSRSTRDVGDKKRSFFEMNISERGNFSEHDRYKRGTCDGNSFFCDEGSETMAPDHEKTLLDTIKREWGAEKIEDINPDLKKIIMTELEMQGNTVSGYYTHSYGKRAEFKPKSGGGIKTLASNLNLARKEGRPWLNVEKIVGEFNMCYFMHHSQTVDSMFSFKAGPGLKIWYYKVSCWRRGDFLLYSLIIYYDEITFAKVSHVVTKFQKLQKCDLKKVGTKTNHHRTGWWFRGRKWTTTTNIMKEICSDVLQSYNETLTKNRTLSYGMRDGLKRHTRNKMILEIRMEYNI